MKQFSCIVLLIYICSGSPLRAKDYTVIEQLPQEVAAAMKEGHKGWDTGVTGEMKAASARYNETMLGLIKTLARTYYREGAPSEKRIDAYLASLYTVHFFKQDVGNPGAESLGTNAPLFMIGEVSAELESTITEMVRAITKDDPKFDYKAWEKKWLKAKSTGHSRG